MTGARRRREWLRRAALLGAGLLAGLLVLEGGLRVLRATSPRAARALHEWDPFAEPSAILAARCYVPRGNSVVHYENGAIAHNNRLGYRGPAVSTPKPSGVFRILLLGGSTSYGFGVGDDETIDAHLRRELARRRPGRRFEVVNLGFDGYDSECDYERLRLSGLPLEPDAVIVHSGINDVAGARFAPPRREVPTVDRLQRQARHTPGLWDHAKHRLLAARAPGLLKHLLSPGRPRIGPSSPPPQGPDLFETNLSKTVALVHPRTVLLFSTPPSPVIEDVPGLESQLLVNDGPTTLRYRAALSERTRRVAGVAAREGRPAIFVPHEVPSERFLDNCHLDREGNRLIAVNFADALLSLIDHPKS